MASRGSDPIRRPLRVPRLPAPKFPPVLSLAFAWTLLWAASAVAQPLPPVPVPAANPITPQKAVLGKILILVIIILFIQRRPRGLFALKGRAVET